MNPLTRKMMRRAAAVGAVSLAAAASLGVMASPRGEGPQGFMPLGGKGLERMLDSVEATADQRTQIETIVANARADMEGQREAGKALKAQMAKLFTQPTVDSTAVESLRQQMLAQHDQASQRMTQTMLEVSRVLTAEQRQQIAQRMAQRAEHMQERQARRDGAARTTR